LHRKQCYRYSSQFCWAEGPQYDTVSGDAAVRSEPLLETDLTSAWSAPLRAILRDGIERRPSLRARWDFNLEVDVFCWGLDSLVLLGSFTGSVLVKTWGRSRVRKALPYLRAFVRKTRLSTCCPYGRALCTK